MIALSVNFLKLELFESRYSVLDIRKVSPNRSHCCQNSISNHAFDDGLCQKYAREKPANELTIPEPMIQKMNFLGNTHLLFTIKELPNLLIKANAKAERINQEIFPRPS